MLLNQPFKVTSCLDVGLNRIQMSLEGQPGEWVCTMQPAIERVQHHRQAAWELSGVVFAQPEFNRVHGCFDHIRLDSAAGKMAQGVQNQAFDFVRVLDSNSLEASGENHLAKFVCQTTSR